MVLSETFPSQRHHGSSNGFWPVRSPTMQYGVTGLKRQPDNPWPALLGVRFAACGIHFHGQLSDMEASLPPERGFIWKPRHERVGTLAAYRVFEHGDPPPLTVSRGFLCLSHTLTALLSDLFHPCVFSFLPRSAQLGF